jgi:hypothetical protein
MPSAAASIWVRAAVCALARSASSQIVLAVQ